MRGSYVLSCELKRDMEKEIGSLGRIPFRKGYYFYVGSADGKTVNIENRTARHKDTAKGKTKKLRWHIDHFLSDPNVDLIDIKAFDRGIECNISKKIEKSADTTVRGFGSSDCTSACLGHLHYFKRRPNRVKSLFR